MDPKKTQQLQTLERDPVVCLQKLDFDKLKIAVNKYEGEIRARGIPGKLVMLFSAFGHTFLSAMNYSNPFSSPKRTPLIGFDLPENCCVSEPQWRLSGMNLAQSNNRMEVRPAEVKDGDLRNLPHKIEGLVSYRRAKITV